jgi:hypothetical protein
VSKKVGILGIVALAMLLGSTGAFAQAGDKIWTVSLPGATEGQIYDRTTLIPHPDHSLMSLPSPPTQGPPPPAATFKGPKESFGSVLSAEPGLAMITPRGAAMSSPKQVADRQIKRLIKRLD